jgi:hypothetical protein
VNRIWIPGTPASRIKGFHGRTPKSRDSEAFTLEQLFDEKPPAMELPGLDSLNTLVFSSTDNSANHDVDEHLKNASTMVKATPKPESMVGGEISVDEDDYLANDPPSMTLMELLLTVDTSQFGLLGMYLSCLWLI